MASPDDVLFDVATPLGFRVRTTVRYWALIAEVKHPNMRDRLSAVQLALASPDEVRLSVNDDQVYVFYREDGEKRWVCSVARRLNGDGFLITAYRTSALKEGEVVWQK
jgi:hypothetical protein